MFVQFIFSEWTVPCFDLCPNTRRLSVRNGSNPPAPWLFVPWARIWSCPARWVTQFLWGACSWVMRLAFVLYPSCVQKTNGIKSFWQKNGAPRMAFASDWSARTAAFASDFALLDFFSKVHVSLWLAIIYFVKAMRLNYRWTKLMTDMESVFGVKNKRTFQTWRGLYQDALKLYLQKHGSITLGKSPGDVVVFDETHIGIASEGFPNLLRVKGQPSSRSAAAMKQKIAKRLPARTVHKRPSMKRPASSSCRRPAAIPLRRPASVMKSIYNKGKKRTDKDARSGGRWLFAAVLVGNKKKGTLMRMAKRDSPFLCCQSLL